ncbi:MAG: DegT/DnrJ/EryC1/StrS family aminotransferase [bacterium]
MKIPFFKPQIDEETIKSVGMVLRSGWLTTGSITAQFEEQFAEYVHAKHAVMVNSGTAALHLCLAFTGIKPGDEVITTPYTFAATAEVIEYFNARPVFVDIRDDNLNINESLIPFKITEKTRAIIPVHFAGHPCEMNEILNIAEQYKLYVFEDAAHCPPAVYMGETVGSIGHAACFSFYANKCITTGEGGMITTDNNDLYEKAKILRLHSLSKDAAKRYQAEGSWKYDITGLGYKYNPTDFAAAIGIGQLKSADKFFNERKRVVEGYKKYLGNCDKIKVLRELEHVSSSWHIFPVRLPGKTVSRRDEIIEILKERGISTSVHFIPLHIHSYYKNKYGYNPDDFPVAYNAYKGLITLPVYPALKDEEVEYISSQLIEIIEQ